MFNCTLADSVWLRSFFCSGCYGIIYSEFRGNSLVTWGEYTTQRGVTSQKDSWPFSRAKGFGQGKRDFSSSATSADDPKSGWIINLFQFQFQSILRHVFPRHHSIKFRSERRFSFVSPPPPKEHTLFSVMGDVQEFILEFV